MIFRAMLIDAYRELNSKALFWVVLGLSAIVVLVFASIGFDDKGVTMFFGLTHVESEFLVKGSPIASMLYRSIFATIIVQTWLAWIATILALISTTTIFPDFVASGAIDIVLAKPVSRLRLFVYKYVVSLLFVLLQVSVFCGGVFLCMGWRLGEWEWRVFAAIPVVVVFFSYLFSFNVLVGIRTRSALTALLLTLLFWFFLFMVNSTEEITNQFRHQFTVQAERKEAQIADQRELLERMVPAEDATEAQRTTLELQREATATRIEGWEEEAADLRETAGKMEGWHRLVYRSQMVLPKTAETITIVDRWLRRDTDINLFDILQGNVRRGPDGEMTTIDRSVDREVLARIEADHFGRSPWFVISSSLAFELALLGLAAWMFSRRDF